MACYELNCTGLGCDQPVSAGIEVPLSVAGTGSERRTHFKVKVSLRFSFIYVSLFTVSALHPRPFLLLPSASERENDDTIAETELSS